MEELDVLDDEGRPTGERAPRALVHARGLWHRAFHLFIAGARAGAPFALLQLRAPDKDVGAGKLDVAVGGHYRAGEALADVVREAEEEIGLCVAPGDLTHLWTQAAVHEAPGTLDREWQEVYLLRRADPPKAYQPDPVELAGLVEAPLDELVGLLSGARGSVLWRGVFRKGEGEEFLPGERRFTRADFIPGDEANLLRVARAARAALR